ncbi:MAG TPA: aldolase [Spirochaeta sp.]|nr:aldolase [Spirochaeta sp.]
MKRRWNNIFREDNKSFVLAMDHAMLMDVSDCGLSNPADVIRKSISGGVDAILTTFGVAENFQKEIGRSGLILRVDGGTTILHPGKKLMDNVIPTFSVEDAVRVGADGVMCMGFPGLEPEDKMIQYLSMTASECKKWGIVFGAEMVPGGFINDEIKTVENVSFANRLGAEYGADFVKSPFVGDSESFKVVTANCYKPVLVLGGSSSREDKDLLQMVRDAMDAGAAGVTIGRNIWRHNSIETLCLAISKIIHEDYSVESALKLI